MKKIIMVMTVMVVFISALSANGAQEATKIYEQGSGRGLRQGAGDGRGNGQGRGSGGSYREDFAQELSLVYQNSLGSGVLTSEDVDGLILISEEEKLARDVYLSLYKTWNLPMFINIAESEQQHMDAVKMVMEAYGLSGPETLEIPGSFINKDLEELYDQLLAEGQKSLSGAFNTAAMIEDLDIYDLQNLLAAAENDEVKILYQNLMKGSRNHLRSFSYQLEREGLSYEVNYISNEYYQRILSLNREIAAIEDPDYSI